MLRDEINIKVQSGDGGPGSMATQGKRYFGGDGGKGGDVYIQGNSNVYDLSAFDNGELYRAKNGGVGSRENKRGANGEDLVLQVPLTTEVYNGNTLICKIENDKQREKIVEGGQGHLGNVSLRKNKFEIQPQEFVHGKSLSLRLLLKLKSDIAFIGYPNAGKSSMLNELTNANAKTAAYAFTTIEPQLGYMDGYKLMDLPGLIDGTSEGKGLGTRFVKHVENCKLLLHFVSLENEDPFLTYSQLRNEIKNISDYLFALPELVLLTKYDERDQEFVDKVKKEFDSNNTKYVVCSIVDEESIRRIKEVVKKMLS